MLSDVYVLKESQPAEQGEDLPVSGTYIHKLETYSDILIMEYKTQFSG